MEAANKAEAERCVDIAKAALRQGQQDRAVKFLNKAVKLDPSSHSTKGVLLVFIVSVSLRF